MSKAQMSTKNSATANLAAIIDAHLREADFLARATDARDIRHQVQAKNYEIARLNGELNNLRAEKWAFQQKMKAPNEDRAFVAVAVCFSERESEELRLR
ncbi:hypothetical protein MMC22_005683 [Lobaria immixta]|nr:hypothetical protein [Lobaria immixta]